MGARHISALRPKFEAINVGFVGVGHERLGIEFFIKEKYFDGDLYLDETKQLYTAFGTKVEGIKGILKTKAWEAINQAKSEGFSGNLKGNGFQMGGTFVMDTKNYELVFAHRSEFFGDEAKPEDILKCCQDYIEQNGLPSNVQAAVTDSTTPTTTPTTTTATTMDTPTTTTDTSTTTTTTATPTTTTTTMDEHSNL